MSRRQRTCWFLSPCTVLTLASGIKWSFHQKAQLQRSNLSTPCKFQVLNNHPSLFASVFLCHSLHVSGSKTPCSKFVKRRSFRSEVGETIPALHPLSNASALPAILRCCSATQKLDFQSSCLSQLQVGILYNHVVMYSPCGYISTMW